MSDAEFVEKVRSDLSRNRKIYIWILGFFMVIILVSLWMCWSVVTSTKSIGHGQGNVDLGLVLGFVIGMTISFIFIGILHHAIFAFCFSTGRGYFGRSLKLLVKFYDERRSQDM